MKIVLQRVAEASVSIDGEVKAAIGRGLCVLVGVEKGDTEEEAGTLARKTAELRIFPDAAGKMNLSVIDVGGEDPSGDQGYQYSFLPALSVDGASTPNHPSQVTIYPSQITNYGSHDSTALTIVEIGLETLADPLLAAPTYRVVGRRIWTGACQACLYGELRALVELWQPSRIVIDATGIGAGLASFLGKAFPAQGRPFIFSQKKLIGFRRSGGKLSLGFH